MTIEIFKYLVLKSSIDIIAGFNSIDDTKKFLDTFRDPELDDLSIVIQESLGVTSKISSATFIDFY